MLVFDRHLKLQDFKTFLELAERNLVVEVYIEEAESLLQTGEPVRNARPYHLKVPLNRKVT